MCTIVLDKTVVHIPDWVHDLASFRRWTRSDDFPKNGRICYLDGEIWVDMSMEQAFSHNQMKQVFNLVVGGLVSMCQLGRFFPDGMQLTNAVAGLCCVPDGIFVAQETFRSKKCRLIEGAGEGYVELAGTPDMVLEIISSSSVGKDTEVLHDLYSRAGIPEYWLADARGERLAFDIFRLTAKGYVATRKQAGWLKSATFGKSFRLTRQEDELGHPEYTLAVR